MAQRWPPPKPKCPQEEFDEAVQTNIDTFDMTVSPCSCYELMGRGSRSAAQIDHFER